MQIQKFNKLRILKIELFQSLKLENNVQSQATMLATQDKQGNSYTELP